MDDQLNKMLKCQHETKSVLIDYISTYYERNGKNIIKTKVIKMICAECNQLITIEYVIDVDKKIRSLITWVT